MFGIEFLASLVVSAALVYFIRKKIAARKKAKNEFVPLRQKDIKKAKKAERKKENSTN